MGSAAHSRYNYLVHWYSQIVREHWVVGFWRPNRVGCFPSFQQQLLNNEKLWEGIIIPNCFIVMKLKQPLSQLFHLDPDGFIVCTGVNYKKMIKQTSHYNEGFNTLCQIINGLGELSATSQGLKQPITNVTRFTATDQRIYIKVQGDQALGFVKVGQKDLFYRNNLGNVKELYPTCVLDIYVHESCQRTGYGKEIFQKFLREQNLTPDQLAYDRPSPKLISFLRKHYNLSDFVSQNNNYVIFDKFFTSSFGRSTSKDKFNIGSKNVGVSKQKQKQRKLRNLAEINRKIEENLRSKPKQEKIVDSLEVLRSQIQKGKIKSSKGFEQQTLGNSFQKTLNSSLSSKGHPRYSLSMKIKDLSYRVPWAIENQQNSNQFRTTSNAYGYTYKQ